MGLDPSHPALRETPRRTAEAFVRVLTGGYDESPADALGGGFPIGGPGSVLALDIPLFFMCPHHLLPAKGRAHVAFLPRARAPGLGRIARLVDVLGRRLVLQEDLTRDIARALVEHGGGTAAGAIVEAQHGCVAVEDFARRDTVFRTRAAVGPARAVASLDAEIGASLAAPWPTSVSARPTESTASRSPSPSAAPRAAPPKKPTASKRSRRSPSAG